MQKNIELFAKQKNNIIAILDITDRKHTIPVIRALIAGGIRTVEITLRSPHAIDAIRIAREHFPQLTICVGTVTHTEQIEAIEKDAVDFIVSPGIHRPLVEKAQEKSIDLLPGIATPSDILLGIEYGLQYCKFFPAEACGGTNMLNAFKGPFKQHHFCATGGINAKNYSDYLALDNVFAIAGSWLVSSNDLHHEDWDNITHKCLAATAIDLSTEGAH